MATTYDRIRILLHEVLKNDKLENKKDLHAFIIAIGMKQLPEFILNRNTDKGIVPQPISEKVIGRLIDLLGDLKLVDVAVPDQVSMTNRGLSALEPDAFPNAVSVADLPPEN